MLKKQCIFAFTVAALSAATSFANAQSTVLNAHWFGTWRAAGDPQVIVISQQTMAIGKYKYKWSNNIANAKNGCYFSYANTVSKAELSKRLDAVRKVAGDKTIDKKTRGEISKSVASSESALKDLNPGNYKMISTLCLPDESGDDTFCSPTYLVDQDAMYETGPCVNDSDNSFYLKRYVRN